MRRLIGILFLVLSIIAAILFGSPLTIFIDPPSILLVFGTITGAVICRHSWREFAIFGQDVSKTIFNSSILGGITGFLIGTIQMLQNMSDPSTIGPGMAVALLTLFYSLMIGLFSLVLGSRKPNQDYVKVEFKPARVFIGFFVVISVVLASIAYVSPLSIFFDWPSLLLILFIIVGGVMIRHSWKEFMEYGPEVSKTLMYSSYLGGAIGTLIGLVQMLQNMSDPSSIGPAMAVGILTTFYSLLISLLAYLSSRIDTIHLEPLAFGLGSTVLSLLVFFILLISFAKP